MSEPTDVCLRCDHARSMHSIENVPFCMQPTAADGSASLEDLNNPNFPLCCTCIEFLEPA